MDAAWTSTAAPDLPDDAVVLSDRTSLIRAENVVPLYRRNELTERQVLALNEIAGVLDTGALADMLGRSPTAPIPARWRPRGWPPTRWATRRSPRTLAGVRQCTGGISLDVTVENSF